jgi:hypothetical protein
MRSKRAARHRARHHGRRTRRAAHHHDCLRACASPAPEMAILHHAQRAQQALTAALPCTSVARALTRAHMIATRSGRCAARSAWPGRPGSRQSHSLIDLRRSGVSRGAGQTQRSAPLPPTEGLPQRSGDTVEAISQRQPTDLAAWTTVSTSASMQPTAIDNAEAPECMRARRMAGESTGTGGDGHGASALAQHLACTSPSWKGRHGPAAMPVRTAAT